MELIILIIAIFVIAFCLPLLMQIVIGACEIASWIVVLAIGGIGYLIGCAIDLLRHLKWIR